MSKKLERLTDRLKIYMLGGNLDFVLEAEELVPRETSAVFEHIRSLDLCMRPTLEQICIKDSSDVTPEDQKNLLTDICRASENRIVITYGLDMAPELAMVIAEKAAKTAALRSKTIIIVGSKVPLKGVNDPVSDAPGLLMSAITASALLTRGIYVHIPGGRILTAKEAMREKKKALKAKQTS